MKHFFKITLCILFLIAGLSACRSSSSNTGTASDTQPSVSEDTAYLSEENSSDKTTSSKKICVEDLDFSRISDTGIQLFWSDKQDPYVESYAVKRRADEKSQWETLFELDSDRTEDGNTLSYTDILDTSDIQQYCYCIDVTVTDENRYKAVPGKTICASNILICIDPGHYAGRNSFTDTEGYSYAEGDFTLELATKLKTILKNRYGVDSYLTRDSGNITIDGYTNAALDQTHIRLRGEASAGSTLFLSIHTNANNDMANGYPTWRQPIAINRPIIIANTEAFSTGYALDVGNSVGAHLTDAGCSLGIASVDTFNTVNNKSDATAWSDSFNDRLDTPGTICYRMDGNDDYYGVLRGAASVNVPGLIIEHGFHTVPEVRKLAGENELSTKWAEADAQGIADGFDLKNEEE